MAISSSPSADTLKALETAPSMYLVLSPDLYILTVSDLYLKAISARREDITGKHIFEAFPANPDLPDADGVQNINASLQEVLRTRKPHYMAVQRYDVPDIANPGKFIARYCDPSHTPVLNEAGEISYIIQLANNITDQILTEQALAQSKSRLNEAYEEVQVLNEELTASNEELMRTQEGLNNLNDELEQRIVNRTVELSESENQFKQLAEARYEEIKESLTSEIADPKSEIDLTLPGDGLEIGSRHPLSLVRNEIIDIFKRLGFVVAEGPEIEDDWHNFSALNFPEEHPARDMQDTFFIRKGDEEKGDIALRTHTSSVQVRMMESGKPPFRAIMPGRVYRNEAISARAHCFFHQVEGLYVDENVSFSDLKQTLYHFVQELYGEGTKVRFRPSYFPFTEPSAEMDISCTICKGAGCNMCKYSGWVEILGCGMVDPNVLENCGIDSNKFTGFAFGMGMERIANLKYVIRDLRLFSENDVRFLKQFQTEII